MVASIADVAKLARVSPTTVSHAISGKRSVSDGVRERVADAMAQLGYAPSRSARNLALGRTEILGLLVPDIANGYFAELAKGVEKTAINAGYNVIFGNTGFDRERELNYLEMIRSRAVDGIIYAAGAALDESSIAQVIDGLPLVLVDEEVVDSSGYTVVSDNYDGGRQAAEHLLTLGHRSALVLGASESLMSSSRRVAGFTDTWCSGGGMPPVVEIGAFTFEGGAAAVQRCQTQLLAGELSAIFAANDLMALGAISQLHSIGLRVPAQISVVGFDDSPLARFTLPGLTTIRQDVAGLGARATELLIDSLAGNQLPSRGREIREVSLIERETTAPAARARLP